MSKKSSVYFGPPLIALTGDLENGDSVSGRINRAAERYLEIIKRHDVSLSNEEQVVLGDCLSGTFVEPLLIRHLADEVADSEWADSPAGVSLIKKLRAANFAELVAMVEAVGF